MRVFPSLFLYGSPRDLNQTVEFPRIFRSWLRADLSKILRDQIDLEIYTIDLTTNTRIYKEVHSSTLTKVKPLSNFGVL